VIIGTLVCLENALVVEFHMFASKAPTQEIGSSRIHADRRYIFLASTTESCTWPASAPTG
jgi:hypothetical protein